MRAKILGYTKKPIRISIFFVNVLNYLFPVFSPEPDTTDDVISQCKALQRRNSWLPTVLKTKGRLLWTQSSFSFPLVEEGFYILVVSPRKYLLEFRESFQISLVS